MTSAGVSSCSEQCVAGHLRTSSQLACIFGHNGRAGMEPNQMPDSGLPGGAVHHLLNESPAHLPPPESSMLPHHLVMCMCGFLLLLL